MCFCCEFCAVLQLGKAATVSGSPVGFCALLAPLQLTPLLVRLILRCTAAGQGC
jgi:hypothetical protein